MKDTSDLASNSTGMSLNQRFTALRAQGLGRPGGIQRGRVDRLESIRNRMINNAARKTQALNDVITHFRESRPRGRGRGRGRRGISLTNLLLRSTLNAFPQLNGTRPARGRSRSRTPRRSQSVTRLTRSQSVQSLNSLGNRRRGRSRSRGPNQTPQPLNQVRGRGRGRGRFRSNSDVNRGYIEKKKNINANVRGNRGLRGAAGRGRGRGKLRGLNRADNTANKGKPQNQRGRGRGRGNQGRGRRGGVRGKNWSSNNLPPPSKQQLDQELDQYMSSSRMNLDKELDSYMNQTEEKWD